MYKVIINCRYSVTQILFAQDFESSRCHHLLYVAVGLIIHKSVMSIYSDKLAYAQVVINCLYSVAQRSI